METHKILKIISIPVLFLIAFLFALFPRKIKANPRLLSVLNVLTGGVFLGLSLCHMLAESHETLEETEENMKGFPLSYFLVGVGFFLTLVMEQTAHALSHGASAEEKKTSKDMGMQENLITDGINAEVECQSDQVHDHGHAHGHHHHHHDEDEGHHGHSHLPPTNMQGSFISVITIWIALSFHSIMEGIALGTSEETALFIAIVGHKAMDAIAVGAPLVRAGVTLQKHVMFALSFALMSPIGVAIGMIISHYAEDNVPTSIVSCLAAGTFLYVGIIEILMNELAIKRDTVVKLLVLFLGFVLTSVIAIWC